MKPFRLSRRRACFPHLGQTKRPCSFESPFTPTPFLCLPLHSRARRREPLALRKTGCGLMDPSTIREQLGALYAGGGRFGSAYVQAFHYPRSELAQWGVGARSKPSAIYLLLFSRARPLRARSATARAR